MKCPGCGAENPDDAVLCRACSRALPTAAGTSYVRTVIATAKEGQRIGGKTLDLSKPGEVNLTKELAKILRDRSSTIPKDENERAMSHIIKLVLGSRSQSELTMPFLEETAIFISRQFGFSEVAVATKDHVDGLYRYVVFVGMRPEAITAYRKLAYTRDDVTSPTKFPRVKLDYFIDFFPGELKPYLDSEVDTYNRPSQIGKERDHADEMREGDYMNIFLYGRGEIIGWMELARTRDGKIPSRQALKWLELFAAVVGRILYEREYSGQASKR